MTTGTARMYPVQLLMFGTSQLGESRIIRVQRRNLGRRSYEGIEHSLRRWADRQRRRLAADWHPVGSPRISYSEDAFELFARNMGAYRVDQRAIRIDDDFRRWLEHGAADDIMIDLAPGSRAIEIVVPIE